MAAVIRPTPSPCGPRGFSAVEILMAVAIVSFALTPVLYMLIHGVGAARGDRIRIFVESVCHNTLERFGRSQDLVGRWLVRSTSDPRLYVGRDLWDAAPQFRSQLGIEAGEGLLAAADIHQELLLKIGDQPSLDLLVCRMTWLSDRENQRRRDSVTYARYLIHDHTH